MGDITLNKLVIGDDGKPHKVLGIFPQGKKDVYRVYFSDGTFTDCCNEHLWTVLTSDNSTKTLRLQEIIDDRNKNSTKYEIPLTAPVDFTSVKYVIDPYIIGCLISIGYTVQKNSILLTTSDTVLIDRIKEHLSTDYECIKISNTQYAIRRTKYNFLINKYIRELKKLDIYGISQYLSVPDIYKYNSSRVRMLTLQGIIDSIGYVGDNGIYRINTTSAQLKNDIIFMIQSIGGTVSYKIGMITNNQVYKLFITLPNNFIPIRINNNFTGKLSSPHREIINITYVGKIDCQCILLDSDSHLYLTDNFIVTHNSEVAVGAVGAYLMYRVMCLKNPLQFFHLKPTEKICFAFMNITKTLAEDIGISKFQHTIQMSPWFMARGQLTQKNNEPYWIPPEPIKVIIGSQAGHVIGQPIYYCLDGDTIIYTTKGPYKISDLQDNDDIQVLSFDYDNNKIIASDKCMVKQTANSKIEYEIELEDGTVIKCTPNHRFMLKDGTYKEAQYLTEEDELMSFKN